MESDPEVKGEGNSYDFGARILDPRVGRWFSRDPKSANQPGWSSYKAMLDNPLFWKDPDGETEYETIIVKDEKSGKTYKVFNSISNKVMTNGAVFQKQIPFVGEFNYQYYYDYRHVTYYTFTTDGKLIMEEKTEILYKNGMKMSDNVTLDAAFGNVAKKGDTYDPKDEFKMAGGFYMTGKDGQGTSYFSDDPDYVGDIDNLISILSNYKAKGNFTMKNIIAVRGDENGLWKMLETLMKEMDKNSEKIDKILEVIEEVQKETSNNSKTSENNTAIECVPEDLNGDGVKNGCGHYPASKEQIESGDTLGGKNPKTGKTNICNTKKQ
jgi:RHS repeat-associated protein